MYHPWVKQDLNIHIPEKSYTKKVIISLFNTLTTTLKYALAITCMQCRIYCVALALSELLRSIPYWLCDSLCVVVSNDKFPQRD